MNLVAKVNITMLAPNHGTATPQKTHLGKPKTVWTGASGSSPKPNQPETPTTQAANMAQMMSIQKVSRFEF